MENRRKKLGLLVTLQAVFDYFIQIGNSFEVPIAYGHRHARSISARKRSGSRLFRKVFLPADCPFRNSGR